MSTSTTSEIPKMPNYVYGISIGQFLIGALITGINSILLLSMAINVRLRTAPHCLLGNIWFANLLLGIIVAISNVVDDAQTYVFRKTEGTVAIVNGFVNVSMLLALVTNRAVTVRNPNKAMSTTTAYKIILTTWALILSLTLIKAIIFGLNQIGTTSACFDCFLIFEVTTLVFSTVVTLLIFLVAFYLIFSHRNRTIVDSSQIGPNAMATTTINHQKEYELTLTVGLLLLGFSLTFLAFVFLIAIWLAKPKLLDVGVAEIIITLFYTHCLINPIVVFVRDYEMRSTARYVARCQRPSGTAVGPSQNHQLATIGQTGRLPNMDPPNDLPPIETPGSDGRGSRDSQGRPKYGSTEKVVIHDEIPPPIGGIAFMNG